MPWADSAMKKILLSGFFPDYDVGLGMATIRSYLLKDPIIADRTQVLMKGFDLKVSPEEILRYYEASAPDLLGFSCYAWNIEKTLDLCRRLRQMGCDIPIVLGGPEVSYTAAEFLRENPGLSAIVCGEGEETFRELVHRWLAGRDFGGVQGVVARDGERIIENPARPFLPDINVIPSPYTDGTVDLATLGRHGLGCYESYRGCVYSCSFCVWGKVQNVRYYDFGRVEAELIALLNSPSKRIFLVDAVANLNKERFKKVLRVILDNNKSDVLVDFEMVAELLDDEVIDLLSTLPGGQIGVGLQTTDPAALKNSRRFSDLKRFRRNIDKLRGKNSKVEIFIDLIFGIPGDTYTTFQKAVDYTMTFVPDKIQTNPLMVLPGTHFHREAQAFGIVYDKKAPHIATQSGTFTAEDFKKSEDCARALEFYNHVFPIRMALSILQREGRDVHAEFGVFLDLLGKKNPSVDEATMGQVLEALLEFADRSLGSCKDSHALLPLFRDVSRYFVLFPAMALLRNRVNTGESRPADRSPFGVLKLNYPIAEFGRVRLLDPALDWRSLPRKETMYCYDEAVLDESFLMNAYKVPRPVD